MIDGHRIPRGSSVLVINNRGTRAVDVSEWDDPLGGGPEGAPPPSSPRSASPGERPPGTPRNYLPGSEAD